MVFMEGAETRLPQQCVSRGELPPTVGPVTLENEIPLESLARRHEEEHDGCELQLLSTILQNVDVSRFGRHCFIGP